MNINNHQQRHGVWLIKLHSFIIILIRYIYIDKLKNILKNKNLKEERQKLTA